MRKRRKKIIAVVFSTLALNIFIGCSAKQPEPTTEEPTNEITTLGYVYKRAIAKPVNKETTTYTLETSFKNEDFYFYMYYLGRVEQVPLQTIDEVETHKYTGIPMTYTFSKTTTNSSSVEKQLSKSSENCTSWQKQVNEEKLQGVSISVGKKDVIGGSYEQTKTTGLEETWGTETKASIESAIAKTQETSETISKEVSIGFDERYEPGFYRYILMGDIDVFATIVYNIEEKTYYLDNVNTIVSSYYTLDYSEQADFPLATEQNLPFDCPDFSTLPVPTTDYTPAITPEEDLGISYISGTKTLTVNLTAYQETGIVPTLGNEDWFKNNILTLYPKYGEKNEEITKIKIVGYYKHEKYGAEILNKISNFAIRLDESFANYDKNIRIILQDVAYKAPENVCALDLSGIGDTHKAIIQIKGNNLIEGGDNATALCANNLQIKEFTQNASLTIKGGDGQHAPGHNQSGKAGGNGLICKNLTILSGDINISGGNGGNGGGGSWNGDGTDGSPGIAGSSGGVAIIAEQLSLLSGNIEIHGGQGGNGGLGADGDNAESLFGYKYAKGGNGGNGGNGGSALKISSIAVGNVFSLSIQGGKGGNGGRGGYGGGTSSTLGGTSGNGGNGGNGGNVFQENVATPPTQTEQFIVGLGGNAGSCGGCYGDNNHYGTDGNSGTNGVFNPQP